MKSTFRYVYFSLVDAEFSVIALTETWLTSEIHSSEFTNDNYMVYRCDRNSCNSVKSAGGGVMMAVINRLKSLLVILLLKKCG